MPAGNKGTRACVPQYTRADCKTEPAANRACDAAWHVRCVLQRGKAKEESDVERIVA
jgi:hypothetical protein